MKKLLLIIGAGASKDIHKPFPTGIELANLIDVHLITTKKKDNPDDCPYISPMLNEALRIFKRSDKVYKQEVDKLDILIDELKRELWLYVQDHYYKNVREGNPPSISIDSLIADKFADQKDVINLAKHCIAYHLKGLEEAFMNKVKNPEYIYKTWIHTLFNELHAKGWTYEDLQQNLEVISFNYDRLFEYIAGKAIQNIYKKSPPELKINYIYGSIGKLEGVHLETKNDTTEIMAACYENIRLIGERSAEEDRHWDQYEKVLFIGFGYDKSNLDILGINNRISGKTHLHGMCIDDSPYYTNISETYGVKIEKQDNIHAFLQVSLADTVH